jgi:hypothetical protein
MKQPTPEQRPPRDVREEPSFESACKQLGNPAKLDEALRALYWDLARSPESWPAVFEDVHFAYTESGAWDLPGRFSVWYTFDDEVVHLWHVELIVDE